MGLIISRVPGYWVALFSASLPLLHFFVFFWCLSFGAKTANTPLGEISQPFPSHPLQGECDVSAQKGEIIREHRARVETVSAHEQGSSRCHY